MKALIVIAHPSDTSFCHAAAAAAERGLQSSGHEVTTIDLYAEGFRAAMSVEERIAYDTDDPILDPIVERHVALLQRSELLVFVYPTWWSGLPAILKGWLERTMVPGVGFTFDERTGKVRPGLRHVRRIVGVSTWGSPRHYAMLMNDNGRRVLSRALRMSCGWKAHPSWLALYGIDTSTDADRQAFLAKVESKVGSW
ncbi:MAG: NAD(P)H-dependent oxidoreductase [Ilumatobacter sp.]|nr:NAD(P)H-dependent oxidoreductase [Ilumatobacter sp.]